MQILWELARRAQRGEAIRVGVVGTGFFGAGFLRQCARMAGIQPIVAANRGLGRAVDALRAAGFERAAIAVCDDPGQAEAALAAGRVVATTHLELPARLAAVDVVVEATGDITAGARVALAAIAGGKHIVAANAKAHATIGPTLKALADQAGVVYSDVDGDEPGILKGLFDYCHGLGFQPLVAGNCKGVLRREATPATQASFARAHGLQPWLACAAADGTKLNLELAVVANATGLRPAVRGMTGPRTTLESLVADFERLGLFAHGPIVEYTLGIPNGVFVVVHEEDPLVQRELRYLKMGDGPYYVFHQPHVLIHYAAPLSAARAALDHAATVAPRGAPVVEVVAHAKRDLPAGQRLDGVGGFDCYGLITTVEEARRERLLPIGLAEFARLTRPIPRGEPVTEDAVEFDEDQLAVRLWRQQVAGAAAREGDAAAPLLAEGTQ